MKKIPKMPGWLPIAIIFLSVSGICDILKPEITRSDIVLIAGTISWAILSIGNEAEE